MTWTTSDAGLKNLMTEEGVRHLAYPDPGTGGEPWTIGVGHTGPEVRPGLVWSDEQIMEALRSDLASREAAINQLVKVPLTQQQFDALIDFVFNTSGPDGGAFARSTLLRKLNEGNCIGAADEFEKWNIPSLLIPRRQRERARFLSHLGDSAPPVNPNTVYLKLEDIQRIVGAEPDGILGPQTKALIVSWQKAHNLSPDGIVGPQTAIAMGLVK